MARILTGKEVVDHINGRLRGPISELIAEKGEVLLSLVRMGDRPDDLAYERTILRSAQALGITVEVNALEETASQEDLEALINRLDEEMDFRGGILVFRPLPRHIDERYICEQLWSIHDIDGISSESLGKVFLDDDEGFAPCTAAACIELLDYYGIALEGKRVAVLGRSLVVGKPLAMLLLRRNATVTICHSRTADLAHVCQEADIVICATGRAKAYGAAFFRPGQVVLDVGINFDEQGNLCGDVDFDEVEPLVDAITPVPGGIGSVTTAVLMHNVVKAAEGFLAVDDEEDLETLEEA